MPSVTRKTRTRREERRAETLRRLSVALETLLEQGESFTEVSVERLVSEAGISRSTFYVYFEDKGQLLRAVTEDLTADFLEACKRWWELPPRRTREELQEAFRAMFDAYRPQRALMAAVSETAAYDVGIRDEYQRMVDVFVAGVSDHIRRGQKSKQVDPDLDAPRIAAWLTWMIERGLYQFAGAATKAKSEKYLSAMTDIVWNTLYAKAA
jgi:TetR/AcrR family transcriptional regulator, ethionamide resistance regulator